MRQFVAVSIFFLLAGWSVLVHSYIRTDKDVLRYNDIFSEHESFQKLGIQSKNAWKAVYQFYPQTLQAALQKAGIQSDDGNNTQEDLCQRIGHLVEIYLRSHGLAPCGHREYHETVGTFCSTSQGTEFAELHENMMKAMYKNGAFDSKTCLYLIGHEPEDWSIDEPWFLMGEKLVPAIVAIDDASVAAKRKALVASGFQTAEHWSYDDVRKAVIKDHSGETIQQMDAALGVSRGELTRVAQNSLVRQVFLLRNWRAEVYDGSLKGLVPFVISNINRQLDIAGLNKVKAKIDENAQMAVKAPVQITIPAEAVSVPGVIVEPEAAPSASSPAGIVNPKAAPSVSSPAAKPETSKSGFARAYGGSRFSMNWGNQ